MTDTATPTGRSTEIAQIAKDAYVFFFPMLMGYRFVFGTFLVPELPGHFGPLNGIFGTARTMDHNFRDVITPNADTPYSFGGCDLRAEPMVLSVPAVRDRYYVMQIEDLFGQNEYFIGSRVTGTGPGSYLIAGPRWDGEVPEGIDDVLRVETDLTIVIGRTQLLGPDDIEACGKIMAQYQLQPLSEFSGGTAAPLAPYNWPVWNDEASRDERFIGYANALLPLCQPTHPDEVAIMARFAEIGIGPDTPIDADALDDSTRDAIRSGVAAAREAIEANLAKVDTVNGWTSIDPFGNRETYAGNYMLRAVGAMAGYGGNDKIEAFYPAARADSEGRPLDGSHRYTLRLDELPPVNAFWSLTMYDTSYDGVAGYLVQNPIDRFLINSTTEGLVYGPDGSLTMYIQHDEPDTPEGRANWLPAPEGPFYVNFRMYWPTEALLDGTWMPPPIMRS